MAVFNPEVQPGRDNSPDFSGVSRPISSPIPDTSGQYVGKPDLSGASWVESSADLLNKGVTALDKLTKQQIDTDTRNTLEPIREDFTNQLLSVRQQQLGVVPSPVQTSSGSTATDVLPTGTSTQSPPNGVVAGIQKVAQIQNFMDSGKANDTYYDMRLKTAVTQLRERYPGYVDYIDAQTSKIVGVNPANATVQNLMADINKMQTNKATKVDKLMGDVMKSGYEDSPLMLQKLRQNGEAAIPEVEEWYARQTMFDSSIKRQDAIRNSNKGTREDIAASRQRDFTNYLGTKLSTDLDKVTTIPGINTPGKVMEIIQDAAANPNKYTDAQMRQYGVMIQQLGLKYELEARAKARDTSKDNQGRSYSYYSDVGQGPIDDSITKMAQVYQNISDSLIKGGVNGAGLAFQHAIHAQAILGDTKDAILSHADVGADAAITSVSKELFGDTYVQALIQRGLTDNLDTRMRPVADSVKAKIRLGFDEKGTPVTLADSIQRGKDLQDAGKITDKERARYTGSLVNLIDDFKDPSQPTIAKERLIKSMFTTKEGQTVLSQLGTDYTDPNTNQFVPGKYSVWTRFTSPDVVKEIKKMGPEYQQIYKNWVEKEAGASLFQKEIQNLNHFTGHDDLHFKYFDGNGTGPNSVPHIELISDKGALAPPKPSKAGVPPTPPPSQGYVFQVQKIVNRVNDGLAGLARVQKELGGDPNSYLLDFLTQRVGNGLDSADKWEGKLATAIAASRAPMRRIEDTFEDAKGKNK